MGFIKDNDKEPQILLNVALEDCRGIDVKETWEKTLFNMKLIPSHWYSEEGLVVFDKNQELSVQVVQNNNEPIQTSTFQALERICGQEINVRNVMELDSKKVLYGRGLGLCKKALNIAVMNGSNTVLENILQRFINEQASVQNKTVSEQELDQAGSFAISNPSQHKSRGRPANKRYLLAIENHNSNNVSSNNQDEDSESRPKRKTSVNALYVNHDTLILEIALKNSFSN
ncbi:hypothetical protein C2G38_2035363 [Gigaspora rosea]|uniref:Uncharacterized protein n=1 Tax=Gigaspora rosea TaxID=44941 RepID=A0A397VCY8_9GLOM|nr:hypothetical protein C2G38_2035363 [Gigaspora rosea]